MTEHEAILAIVQAYADGTDSDGWDIGILERVAEILAMLGHCVIGDERAAWQDAVANGTTTLGLVEWMETS